MHKIHHDSSIPRLMLSKAQKSLMIRVISFSSVQSLRCVHLFVTLSSPTGFPVHYQLPGRAHTHIHRVSEAIQPSYPLPSPSLPALNLSQHQGLSNESVLHIRWPKYWCFSCSISASNEYSRLISFRMDWFDSLLSKGLSRVFSNTTVQKHRFFSNQPSL